MRIITYALIFGTGYYLGYSKFTPYSDEPIITMNENGLNILNYPIVKLDENGGVNIMGIFVKK